MGIGAHKSDVTTTVGLTQEMRRAGFRGKGAELPYTRQLSYCGF